MSIPTSYPLPSPRAYRMLPFEDKQMWIQRLTAMEAVIGVHRPDVRDIRFAWLETERP